ncbi:MAG: lysylphosphatidylglycerol synthase transmembrane domain-containing protein [Desulfobacteraceae bacterium]
MGRACDWKFWAGMVISAVFLYAALRQVDLARLWDILRTAGPLALASAVFLGLSQHVIRALRWRIFLDPVHTTTMQNRLLATLVGFAANCLLPARIGEIIRANYLGVREGFSGSAALGTVVIERLFDGLTLLLILEIGLQVTDFPADWQALGSSFQAVGLLLLGAYVAIILLLIGFKWKAHACLECIDRVFFFVPKRFRSRATLAAWNFSLGIVLLKRFRSWVAAVLLSCLIWSFGLFQIQAVAASLGLPLPFIATFLILAVTSFGVMIPSAPGFIGTFHLAVQYGFLVYGYTPEEGLSAGILLHAAFFVPTVLAGMGSFFFIHTPLGRLASVKAPSK